jgi:hypothetical protein
VQGSVVIAEAGFGALSATADMVAFGGEPQLAPAREGGIGRYLDSADFGAVAVGSESPVRVYEVKNVAFTPTTVAAIDMVSGDVDDFEVVGGTCAGATLDAEATCTIEIMMAPSAVGERRVIVAVRSPDGSYTTLTASGSAFRDPQLAASVDRTSVGRPIVLIGTGFSADAEVTLQWADGRGLRTTVRTDDSGAFLTSVVLRVNERSGVRTLVAQSPSGETASVVVRVSPAPMND